MGNSLSSRRRTALLLRAGLAEDHGKAEAALVASATSGIALVLMAAGIRGRRVAIPNNVCWNVPHAVLCSGNEPVFLDIEPTCLGLDPAALAAGCADECAAVIAVHAYGCPCAIAPVAAWCRARGVLLIEDAAVAQGARAGGVAVGGVGDVSVLSFGRGKILDGGGGGAVLSNDSSLLKEIARLEATLPESSLEALEELAAIGRWHTSLYNAHYGRDLNDHWAAFRARAVAAAPAVLRRPEPDAPWVDEVFAGLGVLEANLARRAGRAEWLFDAIGRGQLPHIRAWIPPEGAVYWRANFFMDEGRDDLLRALLQEGIPASSWQASADLYFADRAGHRAGTPTSDAVGDTILNLWVNDEVEQEYLERVTAVVSSHQGARFGRDD